MSAVVAGAAASNSFFFQRSEFLNKQTNKTHSSRTENNIIIIIIIPSLFLHNFSYIFHVRENAGCNKSSFLRSYKIFCHFYLHPTGECLSAFHWVRPRIQHKNKPTPATQQSKHRRKTTKSTKNKCVCRSVSRAVVLMKQQYFSLDFFLCGVLWFAASERCSG